jgi:hypothetical protein
MFPKDTVCDNFYGEQLAPIKRSRSLHKLRPVTPRMVPHRDLVSQHQRAARWRAPAKRVVLLDRRALHLVRPAHQVREDSFCTLRDHCKPFQTLGKWMDHGVGSGLSQQRVAYIFVIRWTGAGLLFNNDKCHNDRAISAVQFRTCSPSEVGLSLLFLIHSHDRRARRKEGRPCQGARHE